MALGWVAAFAAAFAAQVGTPPPARTVPCSEAIATTRFPYQDRERRYRLILGVVSLPTYLEQIVPSPDPRWPYWRKQGLVVRASGETVTITVPRAWRHRVAIDWGYGGTGGPFGTIRIACHGADATIGRAFSGGFSLRTPSACVPLVFRVGNRSATIRFGLGERCVGRTR